MCSVGYLSTLVEGVDAMASRTKFTDCAIERTTDRIKQIEFL